MAYNEFSNTAGKNLEKALSFVGFNWHNGSCSIDTTGTNKDKLEGTDFEIMGVRCDATANPEKSQTQWNTEKSVVINLDNTDNITVRFGIRTGNGVVEFETPVLVFLFESYNAKFLYSKFDVFSEALLAQFSELVDEGMDIYWDFIDSHPQYEV